MKHLLTATLVVAIAALVMIPSRSLAASDTLFVYAKGLTLDKIISADTVAGGAQAHKYYLFASRDTTYIFDATITIKSTVTLLGILDPTTGRPPCIQPDVLSDNSIPGVLFTFTGKGTRVTLKNLYLLGLAVNNTANLGSGQAIQVSGDSLRLAVDNVVFEEWSQFAVGYSGNWDKFFITNCKFRNMVHPNQWYVGEVLRNENYLGKIPTDSTVMKFNTMLCVNGYASAPVTVALVSYFDFSHNSVIYTFKNPFFIFNVTDAKINDNLFYSAWSGGISKTEYPWWDQLWSPAVGSIIDFDALDSAKVVAWKPALPTLPAGVVDTAAEKLRTIQVKNNAYFWPTTLTTYWQTWNDTAHTDSIYTATWMNARTTNMMVTDKVTWPGLVASGNQNVDPGFGTTVGAVLNSGTGYGIGLLNWFKQVRTGTAATDYWAYKKTTVGAALNWTPTWPLPETQDMKYSNTSLKTGGTDGRAIGDPYWFNGPNGGVTGVPTGSSTPREFALSSAYPNPFNPTTSINFTLKDAGFVSLKVYNMLGQVVATIIDNEMKSAETHTVRINMSRMTSGIYFAVLQQGNNRAVQKLMLLK
ncbi:MAG: T9SS type A sorting domain-containing protein [Bacteroidota bacterium]